MIKNIEKNNETVREFGQIMGINVSSTSLPKVLTRVRGWISHNSEFGNRNIKFYIVTPNPELVVMAGKDPELKLALNSAKLAIPDGVGLSYAYKFLFGKPLNIIPGRKLFTELIELANKKGWKVFFLGGLGDEAAIAAEKLRINYKSVKIETFAGPRVGNNGLPVTEVDIKKHKDAIDRINKFKPQLLFVAMQNPKQEKWIYKNLKNLDVGGAMAVGGTFRYVSGLSKLPPKWMEKLGLEWIWRFVTEPSRLGRILNAFPIFPLKVFWYKLTSN